MITLHAILAPLGFFAVGVALCILGLLSRRLGEVTRARSFYIGHFVAAVLVWAGALMKMLGVVGQGSFTDAELIQLYALVSDILPALGITLGLLVTWYYWSWLLAERD